MFETILAELAPQSSLMYKFPLFLHRLLSVTLWEGGKEGRWVGTSDMILTSISNGKLDSFYPHELPLFLFFFLSHL